MRIGLEIHIQLPTKSKLFCSCSTSGDEPNSSVCPTCLGFPGSKPSLNRRALETGILIAKFLDCQIPESVWFSRKTYFYPDLPKHFQITQYDSPVGTNGKFVLNGKVIHITRAHLEEDPGRIKRVGRSGEEIALIDYNRSGIPLVEVVTDPDLSSPAEARDFLTDLLIELRHLVGISGQDEQTVRVDANISVGEERVEIKNITGLKNVERGLKFEVTRQTKMLGAGKKIVRETRRFDEERGVTLPAREKEFEEDYGYIGEPDLGIYHIGKIGTQLTVPETPLVRAKRLQDHYGVGAQAARQIVLTSWQLADLFELLRTKVTTEEATTWVLGAISSNWKDLQGKMNEEMQSKIADVVVGVCRNEITDSEGKMRISALASGTRLESTPTEETGELDQMVRELVDKHPEVVKDYRANEKAANYLIGQVMKETKGKYSSKEIVAKIRKELEKRV